MTSTKKAQSQQLVTPTLAARQFKQARPDYFPCEENLDRMIQVMAHNFLPTQERDGDRDELIERLIAAGAWNVPHLSAAYDALSAEGLLETKTGEPRELTEREHLRVARLAQAGRLDRAIREYLRCALNGEEPSRELLYDPKYRQLCDDAAYTVFEESQFDYVPTASRKAHLLRFAGKRPLTIALLREAWRSCKASEQQNKHADAK